MARRRAGLGRGLAALIPEAQQEPAEELARPASPLDVFFGDDPAEDASASGSRDENPDAGASDSERASRTEAGGRTGTQVSSQVDNARALLMPSPRSSRRKRGGTKSPIAGTTEHALPTGGSRGKRRSAERLDAAAGPDDAGKIPALTRDEDANAPSETTPAIQDTGGEGVLSATARIGDSHVPDGGESDADDLIAVAGITFGEIPVDAIIPNRKQPREVFDEELLEELATSIKEVGVLQPIVVRRIEPDVSRETAGDGDADVSRETSSDPSPENRTGTRVSRETIAAANSYDSGATGRSRQTAEGRVSTGGMSVGAGTDAENSGSAGSEASRGADGEEMLGADSTARLASESVSRETPDRRPLTEGDSPSADTIMPRYELIMGERRWRACQRAGLKTVPAIVRHTEDSSMLRDALLENLHRAQLNPLEEAAAYEQLLDEFGCTQAELSQRIARSRSQIANTIRLLRLPASVQRRVGAGVLSAGHARALLALTDESEMEYLAGRIVAEGISVRSTEEIVALGDIRGNGARQRRPSTKQQAGRRRSMRYAPVVNRLTDHLETSVTVHMGKARGKIVIAFSDDADLERIERLILAQEGEQDLG